jgi:hypothetical protein
MLGWREGVAYTVLPSRLSKKYAKMASSRQLFWLVDLPLDVYVSILSLTVTNGGEGGKGRRLKMSSLYKIKCGSGKAKFKVTWVCLFTKVYV